MLLPQIRSEYRRLSLAAGLGLGLSLVLLFLPGLNFGLTEGDPTARAANELRYVAPTGADGPNTCTNPDQPCATVQHAVDMATSGDEIRIAAGTYRDVSIREGITQVVYIDKSVTLRGGYDPPNWNSPNPTANPTTLDAQGQGRVMVISGTITATVEGLRITGGIAPNRNCGGVCVVQATATLRNNSIFSNKAEGVFLVFGAATLHNNTIYSNTAEYGGGVYVTSGQAILTGNAIRHNQAALGGGGVAADYAGIVQLKGNTITNNTAGDNGGGVYVYYQSLAELDGNSISGNEAERGGGIYGITATIHISHSQIFSNFAAVGGGGMWLQHSVASLSENTVTTNTGLLVGGGLALEESSVMLSNNIIGANTGGVGGGLYLTNYNEATLTNTIIADNQATLAGSGLHIHDNSTARLLHTTLARNSDGDGSGVYVASGGTAALTNTILVSHTVGITVAAGSGVTLEATLWGSGSWANGNDWSGAGSITTGTVNIWGDPAFAAPEAGNYHLRLGSAALNQGLVAGVPTDIDGEPRPYDGGYDLGADEGQPGLTVTKAANSNLVRAGERLTYTISLTASDFISLTATITDILPSHVTPTGELF